MAGTNRRLYGYTLLTILAYGGGAPINESAVSQAKISVQHVNVPDGGGGLSVSIPQVRTSRGDMQTIAGHKGALKRQDQEMQHRSLLLTRQKVEVAREINSSKERSQEMPRPTWRKGVGKANVAFISPYHYTHIDRRNTIRETFLYPCH